MAKVLRVSPEAYEEGYQFTCPGCKSQHIVPVRWSAEQIQRHGGRGPAWTFNGNLDRPTFGPSLLVRWDYNQEEHGFVEKNICHSFIRDGQIQFLNDCTHGLAGKTVELDEIK
jgi:hypothetical protein